jgi:ankyrin repeat protein
MYAVLADQAGTTELLIQAGADLNSMDEHGRTALHYAAFHGKLKVLRILLQVSILHVAMADPPCGETGCPTRAASLLSHAGWWYSALRRMVRISASQTRRGEQPCISAPIRPRVKCVSPCSGTSPLLTRIRWTL